MASNQFSCSDYLFSILLVFTVCTTSQAILSVKCIRLTRNRKKDINRFQFNTILSSLKLIGFSLTKIKFLNHFKARNLILFLGKLYVEFRASFLSCQFKFAVFILSQEIPTTDADGTKLDGCKCMRIKQLTEPNTGFQYIIQADCGGKI